MDKITWREVPDLIRERDRLRDAVQFATDWFDMNIDDFQEKYHLDDADEVGAVLKRYLSQGGECCPDYRAKPITHGCSVPRADR